ncbi:MAG: CapA family protein [Candidatus Goldbacteria bacterium]|nr:CapA family protein [Candidatus Goldiibacteriota bacterium]
MKIKYIFILPVIFLLNSCAANRQYLMAPKTVYFCAAGDVMLDRGVKANMEIYGYDYPFENIRAFVKAHDVSFCNLETPISTEKKRKKPYAFRCEPEKMEGFKNSGFNTVSIANNHMLDCNYTGVSQTIKNLDELGVMHAGAGYNREHALEPRIITGNGVTIALFAFADFYYETDKDMNSKNTPQPCHPSEKEMRKAVSAAKGLADYIFVSFHWGEEYKNYPGKKQKKLARMLVDSGADLIIGHHPHVLQGIEKYKGVIILYSLGNFVFDQFKDLQTDTMIFSCRLSDGVIKDAYITPAKIEKSRPHFAKGEEAKIIKERLKEYSKGMNVKLTEHGNRMFIE